MNSVQLIAVTKAINVCLAKVGQKPRALRNYHRLIRQGERKLLPLIREWIDDSIKAMQTGLPNMKGKTAAQKTKSITDWDAINANGIVILKPTILELLGEGGKTVVERKIIKQERFDVIGLEAVKWATEHTAALVTEITDETIKAIRAYIVKGIDAGKSVQKIARELRPLVGLTEKQIIAVANFHEMLILDRPEWTVARQNQSAEVYARRLHRKRATMIARTETASALSEGQRQGYSQMGVTHLERVEDPATEDDDCADNNGRIYTLAEAQGVLPAHPNCLLGNSLILPRGRITSVSKRLYNGEVIIIETASKRKLTCTPNHPILSDRGFCSADSLNIGSYVISDGFSQGESFKYWKDVNKPTSIQEIAESFFENRKMMTREMPIAAPDFHGDGIGSKVSIVSTNRFLMNRFNASFKQHLLNLQFKWGKIRRILFDSFSMFTFSFPSNRFPQGCFMSSLNLMFPFSLRHLTPKILDSFATISNINIHRFQSLENDTPRDIVFSGKPFLRPSRNIKVDNIVNGKINKAKPSLTIPNTFLDKIIHKETSEYKGYVYNLETTKLYYIANGIAIHNCEGTWVAA